MKDIIDNIMNIRSQALRYAEEVAIALNLSAEDLPAGGFGMIHNKLTLMAELLSYYNKKWSTLTTTNHEDIEQARKDNAERVIMIERLVFIEVMSTIEYCSKYYHKQNPLKLGIFNGRIYLSRIMNRSRDINLISTIKNDEWQFFMKMRNAIVHNNSRPDEDLQFPTNSFNFAMEKDKMIQGDLHLLPNIIGWLIENYKDWILSMGNI